MEDGPAKSHPGGDGYGPQGRHPDRRGGEQRHFGVAYRIGRKAKEHDHTFKLMPKYPRCVDTAADTAGPNAGAPEPEAAAAPLKRQRGPLKCSMLIERSQKGTRWMGGGGFPRKSWKIIAPIFALRSCFGSNTRGSHVGPSAIFSTCFVLSRCMFSVRVGPRRRRLGP